MIVHSAIGCRAHCSSVSSDHANDCSFNGFPSVATYVMNLTAVASGEPPIVESNYVNFSGMADGLLGGFLPAVVFYFPLLKQNFSGFTGSRYWTMLAVPVADMDGGREQSVWFRFQQIACAGEDFSPPCKLHGKAQYYDTYWFSSSPVTKNWIPPGSEANATGFFSNLRLHSQWWQRELDSEGIFKLELPSGALTNGSWLTNQAVHGLVRSMISRDNVWHPRYHNYA